MGDRPWYIAGIWFDNAGLGMVMKKKELERWIARPGDYNEGRGMREERKQRKTHFSKLGINQNETRQIIDTKL